MSTPQPMRPIQLVPGINPLEIHFPATVENSLTLQNHNELRLIAGKPVTIIGIFANKYDGTYRLAAIVVPEESKLRLDENLHGKTHQSLPSGCFTITPKKLSSEWLDKLLQKIKLPEV